MKKRFICLLLTFCLVVSAFVGCDKKNNSEYNKDGKMILNLRNLYFSEWTGGDTYTNAIEEKFNVAITPSSYSWADWDSQVWGPLNSNSLTDVFQFDVDSYNFANSYIEWIKGEMIKPLPDDMSKWPNVKALLSKTSNIDQFYVDGKLYCIPIAKDIKNSDTTYSPFTYVYRRDWAKELNVYQENDVYSWDQFIALLDAFHKNKCQSGDITAIADVEWGFPSIINFYKDAPHCFTEVNGSFVSNYTTDNYLQGLDIARNWVSGVKKYYGFDQYAANDGDTAKQYYAGRVGVFFENLSLSNYTTLRDKVGERSEIDTKQKLDDATALMKVYGPDGKFALEGTENWFSATFFSDEISEEKQAKILDIMDWLLSEEGTLMAAYGLENYDYSIDADGNVTLLEAGWEKDINGEYIDRLNGAKYLRYMVTLGYDMNSYDPLVDADALAILNAWYKEMDEAKASGKLRILTEDQRVKWLTTPTKASKSGSLLDGANTAVTQYVYGKLDLDGFKNTFESDAWKKTLNEINDALNK